MQADAQEPLYITILTDAKEAAEILKLFAPVGDCMWVITPKFSPQKIVVLLVSRHTNLDQRVQCALEVTVPPHP